jgi:hypothetical protein
LQEQQKQHQATAHARAAAAAGCSGAAAGDETPKAFLSLSLFSLFSLSLFLFCFSFLSSALIYLRYFCLLWLKPGGRLRPVVRPRPVDQLWPVVRPWPVVWPRPIVWPRPPHSSAAQVAEYSFLGYSRVSQSSSQRPSTSFQEGWVFLLQGSGCSLFDHLHAAAARPASSPQLILKTAISSRVCHGSETAISSRVYHDRLIVNLV